MTALVLAVFAATYAGMALGRVPGLRLDRTGIALMAVAALMAAGAVDVAGIGRVIDAPTLVLLFALMILSAQFGAAGLYRLAAGAVTRARLGAGGLLALTVIVSGVLSAVLANDVVCYAMAPLLIAGLKGRGLDPRPFLAALAGASNAGSAATLIGNPQNILIGQTGGLDFVRFLAVCGPPAILALAIVHLSVRLAWREALARPPAPIFVEHRTTSADRRGMPAGADRPAAASRWQVAKGGIATVLILALFATPVPREIGALAIAAMLLASRRMASREMIGAVDWHLLLLIACLFVVTAAFAATGVAAEGLAWLAAQGLGPERIFVLAPLALAASNTIGNVPAVILILALWPGAPEGALYGLALLTTLAGNLLLTGSLANIIVAERAATVGVTMNFADFARAGVPMTLASMAVAAAWLWLGGWVG